MKISWRLQRGAVELKEKKRKRSLTIHCHTCGAITCEKNRACVKGQARLLAKDVGSAGTETFWQAVEQTVRVV